MDEMNQEMQQPEQREAAVPQKSGLATAGFVLGIIGVCLSFIPFVNNAAFFLGILAAVFGLIALIKKHKGWKAITALILGVLSIVITLAMQAAMVEAIDDAFGELDDTLGEMSGEKTDDILEDSLDVTIGSFVVNEEEYWTDTKLTVTLKNKSKEQKSFSVTVEAVDEDGNRLDVDYIYANDLGAGQSQKFDIFTLVTSDELPEMKNATFRVVEVSAY